MQPWGLCRGGEWRKSLDKCLGGMFWGRCSRFQKKNKASLPSCDKEKGLWHQTLQERIGDPCPGAKEWPGRNKAIPHLSTCAKWGETAEGEACCHYVCLGHGLGFSSLHRSLPAHTQPSVEVTHSETQGLFVTLNIILNINNHLNNFKVWKTKYVMKTLLLLLLILLLLLLLRHIWKVRDYTGDKTASA